MSSVETEIWFNVWSTAGLGPAAAQKIAVYLRQQRIGVDDLVGLDASVLTDDVGLRAGVAEALQLQLANPVNAPQVPDGVEMLTPDDEKYPIARLADGNPPLTPILWAAGDTALLTSGLPALAVAGSRNTSPEVLDLVFDVAKCASRQGWMVVSGLAAGVDSAAHSGALAGGSGTIGVLASGLADRSHRFVPEDADELCMVSEFSLNAPWSGQRAMQRNATIASLADRVLVAAAGETGGSWEMAQLCLRKRKDLFVLDLSPELAPGNRKLIRSGAIALDPNDLEQVLRELDGPMNLFG